MAPSRARPKLAALCGAAGLLLIFSAVLIGYTRRSLFDERAFADRISASFENPSVSEFAATQLADAVIAAKPDLVGVRPVLIGVSRSVVSSAAFRAAVRRSARILHRSISSGQARDIVLTVKDAGDVLESAVASQPGLAQKIPPRLTAAIGRLQSLPGGDRAAMLVRFAHRVRVLAWTLLVLGVGLAAACVWLSNDKRRTIVRLGIGLSVLALVLAIAAKFGGNLAALSVRDKDLGPVIGGLSGAFLSGLWIWAMALGLTGLVLAAASASLLERVAIREWSEAVSGWFFHPQAQMRERLLRGVLGFGIGAAMLLWPIPALTVLAWIGGLVVAFLGLREAFVAALHFLPQIEPRGGAKGAAGSRARHGWAIAFVGALALALIAGTAWLVLRSPDKPAVPDAVTAYNGSVGLGERRLDEVIFPTTHNSMGGADVPGWMFPNQSAGIEEQLQDGIRGFLVDIHYACPAGQYVKTQIDSASSSMTKYEEAVGKDAVEAALRIRNRLTGVETGKVDVYMAHGFAELGAAKFTDALTEMHDFLVANPGEVLVMIIQDEGVDAHDIERCFQESGLIEFVYRGPFQQPWPTLREMVDTDQRVVVMTENLRQGIPWVHWAFDVVQETPYTFHHPADFSNAPNRGGTGGSLYLMNHWIESTPMPKPSNADTVNAHDFLLNRILAFEKLRGHVPNLVAVDFYREGDLIAVARQLNEEPVAEVPPPATGKKGRS
ncbi:MAG TPA: hypothetical protein VGR66_14005 [Candidatus Eisenbacteria bacterium]|nr:hypothetical protein [Candidatus Eisenbacteria bacterium]